MVPKSTHHEQPTLVAVRYIARSRTLSGSTRWARWTASSATEVAQNSRLCQRVTAIGSGTAPNMRRLYQYAIRPNSPAWSAGTAGIRVMVLLLPDGRHRCDGPAARKV